MRIRKSVRGDREALAFLRELSNFLDRDAAGRAPRLGGQHRPTHRSFLSVHNPDGALTTHRPGDPRVVHSRLRARAIF